MAAADEAITAAALPFYETVLGFRVLSRSDAPHNSAVLARDQVQIGRLCYWFGEQQAG